MKLRYKKIIGLIVICALLKASTSIELSAKPDNQRSSYKHEKKKKKPFPKGDIKSTRIFYRYIDSPKRARVVTLFFGNDGPQLQAMVRMFGRIEHAERYKQAGVRFVAVNLERG